MDNMDNKEELYYYASGVDISKNYQCNEEKRAIGYDGEYAVFCALQDHFLDENFKVLMNVNVPTGHEGKTTEIDCLLICKTGLVSFEIKNFKGTIYGDPDEENWTQYFRTAENHVFKNPLKQNAYHIQAMQSCYPGVPCYSVVVFTNPDCDASRVSFPGRQGPAAMEFCIPGSNMLDTLQSIFSQLTVLDDTGIEKLFHDLSKYAAHYTPVPASDEKITSFDDLVAEARERMGRTIKDMQEATQQAIEYAKKKKTRAITLALTATIAITSTTGLYAKNRIDWYSEQYQEMHKKFQQVSNDDFDVDLNIFSIRDFSYQKSSVFNAFSLSFKIGLTTPASVWYEGGSMEYENAELLIYLRSGEVVSYSVKDSSESFRHITKWEMPSEPLVGEFLLDYELEDIKYIKISNLIYYKDGSEILYDEGHNIELTVYQG